MNVQNLVVREAQDVAKIGGGTRWRLPPAFDRFFFFNSASSTTTIIEQMQIVFKDEPKFENLADRHFKLSKAGIDLIFVRLDVALWLTSARYWEVGRLGVQTKQQRRLSTPV